MNAERKRQPTPRIETMTGNDIIETIMTIKNEAYNTCDRIICSVVRDDNRTFDNFWFESFTNAKKDGTHTLVIYSETEGFKSVKLARIKSVRKIGRWVCPRD